MEGGESCALSDETRSGVSNLDVRKELIAKIHDTQMKK
jgi:hypothetical protein